MDKNSTAEAVRHLVSENKLEEALRLLMTGIKTQHEKSLDTVILLKGKLALLEEQENAGLLDFEEIMREKAKISRSLLDVVSDLESPSAVSFPLPVGSGGGLPVKMLLSVGGFIVVVTLVFFLFFKNRPASPAHENGSQTNQTQASGEFHFTTPLPLNQPFNIANVAYTIQSAELEKYADPVPPNPGKVKLTLQSNLVGKTAGNGGVSWREQRVRVLVDDEPYAPKSEAPRNSGWIQLDSRTEHKVEFAFPDNGKKYALEFTSDDQIHRFPFAFSRK